MARRSRKRDRKRDRNGKRKGASKRRRQMRRAAGEPINMIVGGEPDCSCPVCAKMAASGQPVMVMTSDGQLVERKLRPPPMMEVYVEGTETTAPHFGPEPQVVRVPVGCVVGDLLEYLCFENQAARIAFPHGSLQARIGDQPCEPDRVVLRGETLVLSATPNPIMSRFLAKLLKPWPSGS